MEFNPNTFFKDKRFLSYSMSAADRHTHTEIDDANKKSRENKKEIMRTVRAKN